VHRARFGQVARHTRFGEHMLSLFQCCESDRAVQVGPRANHHGVNIRIANQISPAVVGSGDIEFRSSPSSRLGTPVADGNQLDIFARLESRYMPPPSVLSKADNANA
jgi:hypothetical protein